MWEATHLGVARVCVKHVREKLGSDGHACYNEAMDVTAVYDEFVAGGFFCELGHAIEINEERDENLVGGWTVFEDTEEVGFEGDGGCRAGMKREIWWRGGECYAGCDGKGWPDGCVRITTQRRVRCL